MGEYICPHCGKPIYDEEALLCLYCGENLKRGVGFLGKIKYPSPGVVVSLVLALTLLGFILVMLR